MRELIETGFGSHSGAPTRVVGLVRRFPVSVLLGTQYAILVLAPSLPDHQIDRGFVWTVVLISLTITIAVEAVFAPVRPELPVNTQIEVRHGVFITIVGLIAVAAANGLGGGIYSSQIGATHGSPLVSLFTPFGIWILAGPAILLYLCTIGRVSRRFAIGLAGTCILAELALGVFVQGQTASAIRYALTISFAAVVIGAVKARYVAVAMLVGLLLWPAIYQLRNEQRAQFISVQQTQNAASQRLQLDRELALAQGIRFPGMEKPSISRLLEFGLLPRFLDPNRGVLVTGAYVNALRGGSLTSNYSFTILGTVYAFGQWPEVVIYLALLCVVIGLLGRTRGLLAFVIATCLMYELLWIEASYPDNIAASIQDVVSVGAAFALIHLLGMWKQGGANQRHQLSLDSS